MTSTIEFIDIDVPQCSWNNPNGIPAYILPDDGWVDNYIYFNGQFYRYDWKWGWGGAKHFYNNEPLLDWEDVITVDPDFAGADFVVKAGGSRGDSQEHDIYFEESFTIPGAYFHRPLDISQISHYDYDPPRITNYGYTINPEDNMDISPDMPVDYIIMDPVYPERKKVFHSSLKEVTNFQWDGKFEDENFLRSNDCFLKLECHIDGCSYEFIEKRVAFFQIEDYYDTSENQTYDFMDGGWLSVPIENLNPPVLTELSYKLKLPEIPPISPSMIDFEIQSTSIASIYSWNSNTIYIEGISEGTTKLTAYYNNQLTIGEINVVTLPERHPDVGAYAISDYFGHSSGFSESQARNVIDEVDYYFWRPSSNVWFGSEVSFYEKVASIDFGDSVDHPDGTTFIADVLSEDHKINIYYVHNLTDGGEPINGGHFIYNDVHHVFVNVQMPGCTEDYRHTLAHELGHVFLGNDHLCEDSPGSEPYDNNIMCVKGPLGSSCGKDVYYFQAIDANDACKFLKKDE